ncbi:MAG: FHA domain-containing protein [Myxococcales bacterium]|nr:FHA domain-containing protein [Myxococcales bacterium]
MAAVYELVVEGEGVPPHSVSVGKQPFSIGRGPDNDLVVPDGMVSWEHLKVWAERGTVWCSDAGSTNGTFVNGSRIRGTVQINAGDRITVGNKLQLHLQLHGNPSIEVQTGESIALEEVQSGLRHPFRSTRFVIGSAADADLRIPGAIPYAAEFALHGQDDIWVMVDTEDRPLEVGSIFEVAGMEFRLVRTNEQPRAPTIQPQRDRFPYALMATLDGPTGPVAELSNLQTGNRVRVEAETRAILLFLLGRRVAEDRQNSTAKEEIGWLPDDDVIVGVWGRSGLPDGANRLKVLVHRLRSEIKKAGFDPWFIERRRRYIRVRVREFSPA